MNITTSYAELTTYLERLGTLHPLVKQVVIGDSEQILSLDRNILQYPVLWIETPDVDWSFDDNPNRYYNLSFVVLINAQVDTWQHQQYILHKTLQITEQLLAKMRDDADANLIQLRKGTAKSSPILGYGHDHDYGWRTSLRVRAYMDSCASDCLWQDVCPVGAMPRFTWTNNILGDFTDIIFQDASLPADESWLTSWSWQVDEGPVTIDKDPPPPNQGPGNYMFVTLTITLGDCVLTASALLFADQQCGTSVPYLLDKNHC